MSYPVLINTDFDLDSNGYDGYNYFFVDCTNNDVTLLMQQILASGMAYTISRVDSSSNVLTLTGKTGNTCNGQASITVPINTQVDCISDMSGTNYFCPKFTFSN